MEFCEKCHNLICTCEPELRSQLDAPWNRPDVIDSLDQTQKETDTINELFKMEDGDKFEETIETMSMEPITDRPLTLPQVCELCDTTKGPLLSYNTMLMCDSCYKKEREAEKENALRAQDRVKELTQPAWVGKDSDRYDKAIERTPIESIIQSNPELKVDTTIKVKTEIFNAKTKSIIDIKDEIDLDPSIVFKDKSYELGKRVLADFQHLRNVLFNFDQAYHKERDNKTSELRSQQTFLNELANRISKEERDRIGLKDLSYKPLPPKAPKAPKVKKKKFNKKELKEYSDKLGGNVEYLLQGLCVQKDITVEEAYNIVKKGIDK